MSSFLTWRPVDEYKGTLPCTLKWALQKSKKLPGEFSRYTHGDFVEGLIAAEVEGAQELMDLMDEHGTIELKEEY